MKVYLNNEIVDKSQLKEIFEPGFLFGWGVFEVFRSFNRKIIAFDEHIKRLISSLKFLGIQEPEVDFYREVENLLKINNLNNAYIRITIYKKRESSGVIIYVDEFGYYPDSLYKEGFKVIVSNYRRYSKNKFLKLKSLSYLENRLSWFLAQRYKKDEALVLNEKNFVVGGSRSNIFLIKEGEVLTPPISSGAFDGITRKIVISILKDMNLKVIEKNIRLESIYKSSEVFLTSSLLGVMPVASCNNRKIKKPIKITLEILDRYNKLYGI